MSAGPAASFVPHSAASLHFKRPCGLGIACAHPNHTDFLPPLLNF